jgi:DNA-binding GntR family transcriptional regulator
MPLPPIGASKPRTKQAFVYQTLRDAIMHCEIAPGERLVIDELARRLDVSAIPVREALHSLTSEGLVVNVPHVGATVAPITRESIIDVFTVLEGLGGMAMRVVAERGRSADLEALDHILREMDDEISRDDVEEWAAHNTIFHTAIADRTGLPLLKEMTERVHDRWHRVRRYYFRGVLAHRADRAQAEHWQMLDAMRRRDFGQLHALSHEHARGAIESYLAYLGATGSQAPAATAGYVQLPEASR